MTEIVTLTQSEFPDFIDTASEWMPPQVTLRWWAGYDPVARMLLDAGHLDQWGDEWVDEWAAR